MTTTQADTFRFVAAAPYRLFVSFVRGATATPTTVPGYTLVDSASGAVVTGGGAYSTSLPFGTVPDTDSRWTRLPRAGTYLLIVAGFGPATPYIGEYLLRLHGADPRPESAKGTLVAGDSVMEMLDGPADVDEFLLTVNGGSPDYVVAVRAESGRPADTLIVERITSSLTGNMELLRSAGTDPAPRPTRLGELYAFIDTVRIRVSGKRGATGPYRVAFWKVDRAPERAARTVTPGDTVTEAHDYARDIDEFTFVGDAGREYAVALQGMSGSAADTLVLDSEQPRTLQSAGTSASLLTTMTGRLPGKRYTLRVTALNDVVARGPYRFVVVAIDPHPERAPAQLAVGDTVGERIDFAPDVDEFAVAVRAGDEIVLYAQASSADTSSRLAVMPTEIPGWSEPYPPSNQFLHLVPTGTAPLRAWRTRPLVVPEAGTLRIRVTGYNQFAGAYRFAVTRVDRAPEHGIARFAYREVVRGVIDPPGDADEYTFDVMAGHEVAAYVRGPGALLSVLPPSGSGLPAYLAAPSPEELGRSFGTGLMTMFVGGRFTARVVGSEQTASPVPYEFVVFPLVRAPEVAPGVLRIGDVVDETIDPSIDVDEFTIRGTPGAKFMACLHNRAPASLHGIWISGWVAGPIPTQPVPPGNIGNGTAYSYAGDAAASCTLWVNLPESGDTKLTVVSDRKASLSYRIEVRAVP